MSPGGPDADEMRARILDTAESLLRRHGLEKLNVIDIARAMNMSHGNVYRHVPSKAALRTAVIHRWLDRVSDETNTVASKHAPADERLVEWLRTLAVIKQRKVTEDAELLAAAVKVVQESPEILEDHAALLGGQLAAILADGMKDKTLPGVGNPDAMARTILDATTRFHHPDMVARGGSPAVQMAGLEMVISLIMSGLKAKSQAVRQY
ncbi:TetR/AcrR family transcriptional regulator [Paraburkholderia unamae]|uniref:TetR/AcrR family transcriptional regulator n=1 Tax=Paraburkholderia unamae TaxID=219649 RepID=UPI000E2FF6DB|nr:TetR family transcriptional regulator [Paraburkholderia unamae]